MNRTTPQERWQAFRASLPTLTHRQKFALLAGGGLSLLGFVVVVLPYLLPLGGLQEVPAESLRDPNGAFITLGGYELYYTQHGKGDEAVLFIHGFWGSSVDWRGTMGALPGYRLLALDLPGLGLSQKSLEQDLSHPAQADLLAAFLDSQSISAAHVVGHDMGGNIAVHLAQRHPQRVKSLVLVAPALQYEPTPTIPDWAFRLGFLKRWARVLLRGIMPEASAINLPGAAAQDSFITDDLLEAYRRPYYTANWDLAILALARDSAHSALAQPLEDMELPVLIVWGEADSWIAPRTADQLAADFPHARRVILPGVGHLPMHEAPADFAAALREFWVTGHD